MRFSAFALVAVVSMASVVIAKPVPAPAANPSPMAAPAAARDYKCPSGKNMYCCNDPSAYWCNPAPQSHASNCASGNFHTARCCCYVAVGSFSSHWPGVSCSAPIPK